MGEVEKGYFTVKEVAEYLSMNVSTVRKYINTGYFPHVKIGRKLLVPKEKLDKMLEEQTKGGK